MCRQLIRFLVVFKVLPRSLHPFRGILDGSTAVTPLLPAPACESRGDGTGRDTVCVPVTALSTPPSLGIVLAEIEAGPSSDL